MGKNRFLYERLFAEIDGLALEGVKAIERGELEQLGELMNINQGLLNALGVELGAGRNDPDLS